MHFKRLFLISIFTLSFIACDDDSSTEPQYESSSSFVEDVDSSNSDDEESSSATKQDSSSSKENDSTEVTPSDTTAIDSASIIPADTIEVLPSDITAIDSTSTVPADTIEVLPSDTTAIDSTSTAPADTIEVLPSDTTAIDSTSTAPADTIEVLPSDTTDCNEGCASEDKSSSSVEELNSSSSGYEDSKLKDLMFDDSEYPYAGIPRLIIETEDKQEITDKENLISAKFQFYEDSTPTTKPARFYIKGRGNTTWKAPKKGYKMELINKREMLGMPADDEWALLANYADKTLMKNYIAYSLSKNLKSMYTPRGEFVELFLNGEYLGVYLLSETIKISKNRLNLPENKKTFLVEFDSKYNEGEQVFFSDILTAEGKTKAYRVHEPKRASKNKMETIENHVHDFETYLKDLVVSDENETDQWIDVEESIKHYWIQEFSKNPDANFFTSVYFSWVEGETIKMGPIWDFDLAFGGSSSETVNLESGWRIRTHWYTYIVKSKSIKQQRSQFFRDYYDTFAAVLDTIDNVHSKLRLAAQNNFKRWNILESTKYTFHPKSFTTYDDAINDFKQWITARMQWLENNN